MKGKILFAALTVILIVMACKKDQTVKPECFDSVSYANDVKPLMELNCSTAGCHDASAAGGYNLSTYSSVSANADRILNVLNHNAGYTPMPMGGNKLADSLIQKVECWVKQGALDN